MDYGRLIQEAWALTWRYRFLWVLGFFAGGAVGASFGNGDWMQWRTNRPDGDRALPGAGRVAEEAARWLAANAGVVIVAATLLVLLGLALLAVSLIARGGMAQASADLVRGRPTSLGQAWGGWRRLY